MRKARNNKNLPAPFPFHVERGRGAKKERSKKMNTPPPQKTFYTDPRVAASLKDFAEKYGLYPKRDKVVGNKASQYLLTSYTIGDTYAVVVTAKENIDRSWSFIGSIDNETVITGTIHGGKWKAAQYIKFVRNGILSRRMKGKCNPQKKEVE